MWRLFVEQARLRDPAARTFAAEVHALWSSLGRKQSPDVAARPQRHSSLPRAHPLVVPGGRFRESYYWDTYFIVRGLVVSGMPVRQLSVAPTINFLLNLYTSY